MNQPAPFENSGRSFALIQQGNVTVVRFNHDTFDRIEIEHVRDDLRALIDQSENKNFIIDFEDVSYMSSVILGVIMGIHLKICRNKGQLSLCALRPQILEIFLLMKLDKILTIHSTREQALAALS